MTEDEIRHVAARLVPQESLLALSSELLEFPWEEVQRRRLVEAITSAVRADDSPSLLGDEGVVLEADDPLVVELREEILASCQPDVLLERSAEILLALVLNVDGEELRDLRRGCPRGDPGRSPGPGADRAGHAGAVDPRGVRPGRAARGAASTSSISPSSSSAWAGARTSPCWAGCCGSTAAASGSWPWSPSTSAWSPARRSRSSPRSWPRSATGRSGPGCARCSPRWARPAVPTLLEWLEDPRWFLVRNLVHVLGKIGDEAAFDPVVTLLGHPHVRVRIEAVRALALIAPARAAPPILPLSRDADPEVRLEAVRALGALRRDEAVPVLRDVAAGAAGVADVPLRREAVEALAAIGTAGSCEALAGLARRRVWPWKRTERRLREIAAAALAARTEDAGCAR